MGLFIFGVVVGIALTLGAAEIAGTIMLRRDETALVPPTRKEWLP